MCSFSWYHYIYHLLLVIVTIPLCNWCCHRCAHFGPPWPGTAGQRRCRVSPRSQGSSSWKCCRHWCWGLAAWPASLRAVGKKAWLERSSRKKIVQTTYMNHVNHVTHQYLSDWTPLCRPPGERSCVCAALERCDAALLQTGSRHPDRSPLNRRRSAHMVAPGAWSGDGQMSQ